MVDEAGAGRCTHVRDLIPEIAAGVAAGDQRAGALRHLSECAECRGELTGGAEVVDELLRLAPDREPPAGFENAVLARIMPAGRRGRPGFAAPRAAPSRRLAVLRAAAWILVLALVAGIAGGTVWWRTADDREVASDFRRTLETAHGKDFAAAPVRRSGGTEIATLFAYEGSPSWAYATFRVQPAKGRYDVRMTLRGGRTLPLDPMRADGLHGWGSRLDGVRVRDIRAIEFLRSGSAVMTARFPTGA